MEHFNTIHTEPRSNSNWYSIPGGKVITDFVMIIPLASNYNRQNEL